MEPCEFLPWDSNFFGFRIGRVNGNTLDEDQMQAVLAWCRSNAIECLYYLAAAGDPATVRLAEDHHFRLMDIRITLQRSLAGFTFTPEPDNPVQVRASRDEDLPALEKIARNSYTISRFYFDANFPREMHGVLRDLDPQQPPRFRRPGAGCRPAGGSPGVYDLPSQRKRGAG